MSENVYKCSRCHSTQHIKYFGENRRGKPYKTCNRCRERNRNKNKDKVEDKDNISSKETREVYICNCGECDKQFIKQGEYCKTYEIIQGDNCNICMITLLLKDQDYESIKKFSVKCTECDEIFYCELNYIYDIDSCNVCDICSFPNLKEYCKEADNITMKETNNSNCAECGKQFINTDKYYNVCKFCTYIEIRKKKEQKRKQKNEKLRQDVGEEFYNKIKKYITNVNECNDLCSYCGPGLECAITFKEGCICEI